MDPVFSRLDLQKIKIKTSPSPPLRPPAPFSPIDPFAIVQRPYTYSVPHLPEPEHPSALRDGLYPEIAEGGDETDANQKGGVEVTSVKKLLKDFDCTNVASLPADSSLLGWLFFSSSSFSSSFSSSSFSSSFFLFPPLSAEAITDVGKFWAPLPLIELDMADSAPLLFRNIPETCVLPSGEPWTTHRSRHVIAAWHPYAPLETMPSPCGIASGACGSNPPLIAGTCPCSAGFDWSRERPHRPLDSRGTSFNLGKLSKLCWKKQKMKNCEVALSDKLRGYLFVTASNTASSRPFSCTVHLSKALETSFSSFTAKSYVAKRTFIAQPIDKLPLSHPIWSEVERFGRSPAAEHVSELEYLMKHSGATHLVEWEFNLAEHWPLMDLLMVFEKMPCSYSFSLSLDEPATEVRACASQRVHIVPSDVLDVVMQALARIRHNAQLAMELGGSVLFSTNASLVASIVPLDFWSAAETSPPPPLMAVRDRWIPNCLSSRSIEYADYFGKQDQPRMRLCYCKDHNYSLAAMRRYWSAVDSFLSEQQQPAPWSRKRPQVIENVGASSSPRSRLVDDQNAPREELLYSTLSDSQSIGRLLHSLSFRSNRPPASPQSTTTVPNDVLKAEKKKRAEEENKKRAEKKAKIEQVDALVFDLLVLNQQDAKEKEDAKGKEDQKEVQLRLRGRVLAASEATTADGSAAFPFRPADPYKLQQYVARMQGVSACQQQQQQATLPEEKEPRGEFITAFPDTVIRRYTDIDPSLSEPQPLLSATSSPPQLPELDVVECKLLSANLFSI
jgi:hypothetical protein